MEKMIDRTVTWIGSLFMAFAAAFTNNADAVGFALILAGGLVLADYLTGIAASIYEGKKIVSKRMRWSFAKLVVYIVSIVGTLCTGILLHLIEQFIEPETTRSGVLIFTLTCVKFEAYIIAWVETVSNVENVRRIFTKNLFLKYVHWILSVEIVKKIPKLSEFLKEKETKNLNDQDNG